MAGMGKRMRPHTLATPKPLLPIAGKPIVQRLVEDLASMSSDPLEEVAFVIGDFGKETEEKLLNIAKNVGARGSIYYQHEALGTAHAIHCAAPSLSGPVIVAFADTLFKADFKLGAADDSVIWVKQIDDPSAFGVVKLNEAGNITGFVEKPKEFVSDLAIIGIYYFRDGDNLRHELQYLLDNRVTKGGEYQLTDALENMKNKGVAFKPGEVAQWMDCGNKNATVETNAQVLENNRHENLVSKNAVIENSVVVPPCFIGDKAIVKNSVVGPYVSLGDGATLEECVVSNAIVREQASLKGLVLSNSMIGEHVTLSENARSLSIGDYSFSD